LVCGYNFLNSSNVDEKVFNFALQSFQNSNLYDLIKNNEKMTLFVVKEQLNHFNITKVNKECKDPLAWWRAHEVLFSYAAFVAPHLLRNIGFQIEVEILLNNIGIYTNMWHFWLGINNLKIFINIYNNWLVVACVGGLASIAGHGTGRNFNERK
jgi:hypothetical protein